MIIVRQSTSRIVTVGPVLDASGVAVTGGVVGDFKISKNGGAPAALNGSATLTHRHTGFYSLSLTTSDLDTVGSAEIVIDDTTNCCPMKELVVIEEAIYDALFVASANAFAGSAGASTLGSGLINAAALATDTGLKADFTGTAQAGATGTITLSAGSSSTTNFFKNHLIKIRSGTGAGQAQICASYNGTTKVATMEKSWVIAPDNTSVYDTYAGVALDSDIAAAILTAAESNPIAANIEEVNTTTLEGDGGSTPWGPA